MLAIPLQLLFFIIAGFFLGQLLDNWLSLEIPVFTLLFAMLGLAGGIWSCVKRSL